MEKVQLYNKEGQVVGAIELPQILKGPIDTSLLWQVIRLYLSNQRQGTADTKTRGEVRGGGKKPWAQKHTGRARQGSIRSPLWRKGGVVFGPHPREHRYQLPAKLRRSALVESLKAKVQNEALVAIDSLEGLEPKTKAFHHFLKNIKVLDGALVVVETPQPLLARISRNIPHVIIRPALDLTCYEVLAHSTLIVTANGLKQLEGVMGR